MLQTRFTTRFGLRYPILSAPMALHSGGTLAAAVAEAGALGTFGGTSPRGSAWVRDELADARARTRQPIGVGFITQYLPAMPEVFDAAVAGAPTVIVLSFADPEPWLDRAQRAGIAVCCQVQTVAAARRAAGAGADVLIVQGNEAGGHCGPLGLLPFLCCVLDAVPDVPVLAAGGIAHPRALAAVLAAGADGACVGTALLATPEAVEVPDTYKACIVASEGDDTVYTSVFDIVEGLSWPPQIAARVRRNEFTAEWIGREPELAARRDEILPRHAAAVARRDSREACVYMGSSSACVPAIRPAGDVIRALGDGAERLLAAT